MSKFKYTEAEQQFNNVLNHHSKELSSIKRPDMASAEACISESEALLKELGISTENLPKVVNPTHNRVMVVPTWEELCNQVEQKVGSTTDLESLFTYAIFEIDVDKLPAIIDMSIDLENQTILLRAVPDAFPYDITFIEGKPGVGKSHFVNEICDKYPEAIVYRFWIGSQDTNRNRRILIIKTY